jgi:hypothetical protein
VAGYGSVRDADVKDAVDVPVAGTRVRQSRSRRCAPVADRRHALLRDRLADPDGLHDVAAAPDHGPTGDEIIARGLTPDAHYRSAAKQSRARRAQPIGIASSLRSSQ